MCTYTYISYTLCIHVHVYFHGANNIRQAIHMAVSGRARFYRVASKIFKMRPGGEPSGPASTKT